MTQNSLYAHQRSLHNQLLQATDSRLLEADLEYRSDYADAQAGLRFRCAHMTESIFYRIMSHVYICKLLIKTVADDVVVFFFFFVFFFNIVIIQRQ